MGKSTEVKNFGSFLGWECSKFNRYYVPHPTST